ncbi:MAG: sugar phosphate isomerase/epimerase [Chloroflexota bacterium]|nr:sugar phosphate isomerase/epimerase [Chloroflexota bacterium]
MRLGFAPITWNNEDLRGELGLPVDYASVLDAISNAGYAATELGDGFPRDAKTLRNALRERGLYLPSAWCGLGFFEADVEADLERTRRLCGFLAEVGASFTNLADQGSNARKSFAGRTSEPDAPHLSASAWDQLAERVCLAAEIVREHGLQATFHPHAGTWVETREDLDELLRRAPAPLLKLCWDVGHAIVGGMDPQAVVRAYPERIAYIHLKDVDGNILEEVRRERLSFDDAIRRRMFTELGRGRLDVPGVLAALGDIGYSGWLMVEQDSTWLPAAESARASRDYLRSLGL